MNRPVILHLSDIHYIRKYLSPSFNERNENLFTAIDKWRRSFDNRKSPNILVISGDLAQSGKEEEFNEARNIINSISEYYKIENKNILICPGNHDYNRDDEKNKSKYQSYIRFYKDFYAELLLNISIKKDKKLGGFLEENLIYPEINFFRVSEEYKILFISINSNIHERVRKHFFKTEFKSYGEIDTDKLKEFLRKIKNQLENFDDYLKIVIMHHNVLPCLHGDESKNKPTEILNNSLEVIRDFGTFGVDLILHGHGHSPLTIDANFIFNKDEFKDMVICGAGSFYSKGVLNNDSFEIIELDSLKDQYRDIPNINISKFIYNRDLKWELEIGDSYRIPIYKKSFKPNQKLFDVLWEINEKLIKKDEYDIKITEKKFVEDYYKKYLKGNKEKKKQLSGDIDNFVKSCINESSKRIDIVCWSFVTLIEKFENEIIEFLSKDNVKFNILMLMPGSEGFLEKTAFEAFKGMENKDKPDLDKLLEAYKSKRKAYMTYFTKSLSQIINDWLTEVGEAKIGGKIDIKFYTSTPRVSGFAFDRKKFCLSYYFVNPIERGRDLPVVVVDIKDMLAVEFLNWFDLNFALGLNISKVSW
jgi:DNA repair exonuclease SbcCD nuclease subunit